MCWGFNGDWDLLPDLHRVVEDIAESFAELRQAAAQRACYLYLRANHIDTLTAHLWRHFHGDERCLPPGYIHALDVLFEMGIYADVEIVKLPVSMRFPSLDVAVDDVVRRADGEVVRSSQTRRRVVQHQCARSLRMRGSHVQAELPTYAAGKDRSSF